MLVTGVKLATSVAREFCNNTQESFAKSSCQGFEVCTGTNFPYRQSTLAICRQ